jgi:hypothetical protein
LSIVFWKLKPNVMIGTVVTSSLLVSFSHTGISYGGRLLLCVLVIYWPNTIWQEEIHSPEYEIINFSFLQIVIFQYFTYRLPFLKCLPVLSNIRDYWSSECDVNNPTCLYFIQIYTLNIIIYYQFDLRKNMFVDVSFIIKCDKSSFK